MFSGLRANIAGDRRLAPRQHQPARSRTATLTDCPTRQCWTRELHDDLATARLRADGHQGRRPRQ